MPIQTYNFDIGNDQGYGRQQRPVQDYFQRFQNLWNPIQQNQQQQQQMQNNFNPAQGNDFSQILQSGNMRQQQMPAANGGSLMDILRKRESGGNYGVTNNLGFTGAYQFGAPALETVGLLKPGAGKLGNKALNNAENWTIPGGKQAFLGDKGIQDSAMQRFMDSNKKTLTKLGLIKKDTPQQQINAMIAAAHLAGPGGVKALLAGRNRKDAYGTGARDYYNMGLKASV
jgi:hypothetical protein